MLFFFVNLSPGANTRWYVGPLLFILPMLLQSGYLTRLLGAPARLLSWLYNGGPSHRLRGQQQSSGGYWQLYPEGSYQKLVVWCIVALFSAWLSFNILRMIDTYGVFGALRRLFWTGFGGTDAPGRRRQQSGARQRRPQTRQQRFEQVADVIQKLPMEHFATRADLEALSGHELKARLKAKGVEMKGALDKAEAISELLEVGGSTGAACSICCEDYASGDLLRVLRCGHRYHLECVDRWFLSASTDYSREPACPMCNASIVS